MAGSCSLECLDACTSTEHCCHWANASLHRDFQQSWTELFSNAFLTCSVLSDQRQRRHKHTVGRLGRQWHGHPHPRLHGANGSHGPRHRPACHWALHPEPPAQLCLAASLPQPAGPLCRCASIITLITRYSCSLVNWHAMNMRLLEPGASAPVERNLSGLSHAIS